MSTIASSTDAASTKSGMLYIFADMETASIWLIHKVMGMPRRIPPAVRIHCPTLMTSRHSFAVSPSIRMTESSRFSSSKLISALVYKTARPMRIPKTTIEPIITVKLPMRLRQLSSLAARLSIPVTSGAPSKLFHNSSWASFAALI